jgi:hypothetical protein
MKKITLTLACFLFVAFSLVQAQTLEEVLKNYHESVGQEVLLKTSAAQTNGKMIQMGLEIPFTQFAASPNKFRVEATFQGMTMIQSFNGEKGWQINPFAGQTEAQPMGEDELKSMKVQADYEGMFWNWTEKGFQVTLEDNEDVEGTDCYVVKVVTPDSDVIFNYIDSENYIAIKTKIKTTRQGQEIESETFMSNFQEVDGYVYAGKIETKIGGQIASTIVIDEMILNPDIDQAIFESAEKK